MKQEYCQIELSIEKFYLNGIFYTGQKGRINIDRISNVNFFGSNYFEFYMYEQSDSLNRISKVGLGEGSHFYSHFQYNPNLLNNLGFRIVYDQIKFGAYNMISSGGIHMKLVEDIHEMMTLGTSSYIQIQLMEYKLSFFQKIMLGIHVTISPL